MTELTLPLALFNLLPVAFTAFGLWWIAGLIDHLDMAVETTDQLKRSVRAKNRHRRFSL